MWLIALLLIASVHGQWCDADEAGLMCGVHGHCRRNVPVLVRLAPYPEAFTIFRGADYCACDAGWSGITCENKCPESKPHAPCNYRHIPAERIELVDHQDETCGQLFREPQWSIARDPITLRTVVESWAQPGMCACQWPTFGPACEFEFDNSGNTPVPDAAGLTRARGTLMDVHTREHIEVCGEGQAFGSRDASVPAECTCGAGFMLIPPVQFANNVGRPFAARAGAPPTTMTSGLAPAAPALPMWSTEHSYWRYSQLPLCRPSLLRLSDVRDAPDMKQTCARVFDATVDKCVKHLRESTLLGTTTAADVKNESPVTYTWTTEVVALIAAVVVILLVGLTLIIARFTCWPKDGQNVPSCCEGVKGRGGGTPLHPQSRGKH